MSFDQLMEHASTIQFRATQHALTYNEIEPEYARQGVDGYFAQIAGLFRPFSQMPDPVRYQPMIDDFRRVLSVLSHGVDNHDPINRRDIYPANPTLAEMTTASDYLEDWTGAAAMLFKQNFLDPFPAIARNQFILTSVLKSALDAHQAMWAGARTDIDNVAHETIDALDNAGGCKKNAWTFSFTVLASVAAVGAAVTSVATAGATLPVTITAVGAAAQVAAAAPPSQQGASGETALQITNAMKTAMDRITREISEVEATISEALRSTSQLVEGNRGLFVAARPLLAGGVPPGSLTGPGGLGTSS